MTKKLLGSMLLAALCAACADGGGGSSGGGSGSSGGGTATSGGGTGSSGGGTSSSGGGTSSTGGGSGVDTSTASASVSTSGGTVTHATGAAVTVPASALASAVTVSITGAAAPGTSELGARAVGQAFVLAPEGQTFLKPISLKVPYDPAQLGGATASQLRLRIAPMGSSAFSELETTVDEQAHTLTATTTHFSVVAPAVGSANPILITTTSLPDGTTSTDYSFTLAVSGGTKPYAFSSPKLPQGLFVDAATGRIYGAPAAGQYAFTIVVADASSPAQRAEKAFTLTIVGGGSGGGGGSSGGGSGGGSAGGGSAGGGSAGGGSAGGGSAGGGSAGGGSAGGGSAGGGSAGGGSAGGGGAADAGPTPVLTALGPASTPRDAGTSGFYVNLAGSNFTNPMSWSVNGKSRGGAVFVDAGLVRGYVDRSITSTAGTYAFTVQNQGGLSSGGVTFTVTGTNPVPVGNAITPSSIGQGSGATGATISGADLISGTVITASNGQSTYPLTPPDPSGNPAQTTVVLPEAMLATPGLWTISLATPAPGGGTSTVDGGFTVVAGNPTPAVRSWTPSILVTDGGAQDLTISGTGFYQGSTVVDQTTLTTFPTVSATSTSLQVTVPADHVAIDGSRTLRVVNAAPGGGQSNLFQVSVKVKPTLTQLSPATATANSGAVLTLTGTGFVPNFSFVQLRCPAPGCSMLSDGGYLPTRTIYLAVTSPTQGMLDLTPTQIPTAGTYGVAVSIEGGHTSNELPLTVQ